MTRAIEGCEQGNIGTSFPEETEHQVLVLVHILQDYHQQRPIGNGYF